MAIELTVSQIIELSGGHPRRMKHLANEDVFLASEKERASRAARTYPLSEAAIACIVSRLDTLNITSPTLAGVAEYLRGIYRVPLDYGFKSVGEGHEYWARNMLLTINKDMKLTPEQKQKQAAAVGLDKYPSGKADQLTTDESHRIRHWTILERAREGKAAQSSMVVKEDGSWTFWLDGQPPAEDDKVDIYIVLNLHRILSVLR